VKELICQTRKLTSKPFGVGVVLAFPHEENIKVILEEKVAVLQVYWGDFPKEMVDRAHEAGVKVIHQVSILLLFFVFPLSFSSALLVFCWHLSWSFAKDVITSSFRPSFLPSFLSCMLDFALYQLSKSRN
jgi:hypothetical protein